MFNDIDEKYNEHLSGENTSEQQWSITQGMCATMLVKVMAYHLVICWTLAMMPKMDHLMVYLKVSMMAKMMDEMMVYLMEMSLVIQKELMLV